MAVAETLSLAILIVAGLWLMGVAILMALRPGTCLGLIDKMKAMLERGSWRLQFTEQGLRVLAGAALVVRAPISKFPLAFGIAGWILVATSVIIILSPMRWHARYGDFLMSWLTSSLIRALSPIAGISGAGLIYAAI
jgi:hypothetical protein